MKAGEKGLETIYEHASMTKETETGRLEIVGESRTRFCFVFGGLEYPITVMDDHW